MMEENRDNNSRKLIAWALTRATTKGSEQVGCWHVLNFTVLALQNKQIINTLLNIFCICKPLLRMFLFSFKC
jgi:hypothetical protein